MCSPTQMKRTQVRCPVGTDGRGGEESGVQGCGVCGKMAPVVRSSYNENINILSPLIFQQMEGRKQNTEGGSARRWPAGWQSSDLIFLICFLLLRTIVFTELKKKLSKPLRLACPPRLCPFTRMKCVMKPQPVQK